MKLSPKAFRAFTAIRLESGMSTRDLLDYLASFEYESANPKSLVVNVPARYRPCESIKQALDSAEKSTDYYWQMRPTPRARLRSMAYDLLLLPEKRQRNHSTDEYEALTLEAILTGLVVPLCASDPRIPRDDSMDPNRRPWDVALPCSFPHRWGANLEDDGPPYRLLLSRKAKKYLAEHGGQERPPHFHSISVPRGTTPDGREVVPRFRLGPAVDFLVATSYRGGFEWSTNGGPIQPRSLYGGEEGSWGDLSGILPNRKSQGRKALMYKDSLGRLPEHASRLRLRVGNYPTSKTVQGATSLLIEALAADLIEPIREESLT